MGIRAQTSTTGYHRSGQKATLAGSGQGKPVGQGRQLLAQQRVLRHPGKGYKGPVTFPGSQPHHSGDWGRGASGTQRSSRPITSIYGIRVGKGRAAGAGQVASVLQPFH